MNDLERLIKRSLEGVGHSYSPSDEIAAREEFIRLRRRRRGYWFAGTAAATAMAVAVALFVVPSRIGPPGDPIQVAARPLEVVGAIDVGGAPASIVSDGDAVWVSNTAGGGVLRIDPETHQTEAVAGWDGRTPDELVVSGSTVRAANLWVTTTEGVVTRLDGYSGEILGEALLGSRSATADGTPATDPVFLDVVAGDGVMWGVEPQSEGVLRFSGLGELDIEEAQLSEVFTDIAYDGRLLWGLDDLGAVHSFTYDPLLDAEASTPIRHEGAAGGRNADLAAGLGYVWVSSGDDEELRIYRIDPSGEEDVLEIPLEGRYADLTVADGRLWVLASGDEESLLYRVTPEGAVEGDPLRLPGSANDIAVGAGSAWVPDTEAGTVLRIKESSGEEPGPVATEANEDPSSAQPFFAYSADGDIYLELTDGSTRQITMSPDEERNPTFALGSLIFERHDYETDWFGLIRHDLASGEDHPVALDDGWEGGSHPAVSAAGDLAWVDEAGAIRVWEGYLTTPEPGSNDIASIPLADGLSDPRGLIFSDDAKALYYQAIGEGWVTVQVPLDQGPSPTPFVLNGINDQPRGTTYVQPDDATGDNITVLDVCCRDTEGDPYSQFSIARIAFTEGGATHEGITGPVPLQDADPGALTMISLHGALFNEDGSWDLFADEGGSWLVTDGATLWLLHSDGGGELAPDTLETGADLHGFTVDPTLEEHS